MDEVHADVKFLDGILNGDSSLSGIKSLRMECIVYLAEIREEERDKAAELLAQILSSENGMEDDVEIDAAFDSLLALRRKGSERAREIIEHALDDKFEEILYITKIGEIQDGEKTLQFLMKCLGDSDAGVRYAAAEVLGKYGEGIREAEEALMALLKKEHEMDYVRERALLSLALIGHEPHTLLIKRLKDKKSDVRCFAAEALGRHGKTKPNMAKQALLKVQGDTKEDEKVREMALCALSELGIPLRVLASPLIIALSGRMPSKRYFAARALGRLGKLTVENSSKIFYFPRNKETDKGKKAMREALEQNGYVREKIIPELTNVLRDDDPKMRLYAAKALGRIGQVAEGAISSLTDLLKQERDEKVLGMVVWAIDRINPLILLQQDLQERAIPVLLNTMEEGDPIMSLFASRTLKTMRRNMDDEGAELLDSRLMVLTDEMAGDEAENQHDEENKGNPLCRLLALRVKKEREKTERSASGVDNSRLRMPEPFMNKGATPTARPTIRKPDLLQGSRK